MLFSTFTAFYKLHKHSTRSRFMNLEQQYLSVLTAAASLIIRYLPGEVYFISIYILQHTRESIRLNIRDFNLSFSLRQTSVEHSFKHRGGHGQEHLMHVEYLNIVQVRLAGHKTLIKGRTWPETSCAHGISKYCLGKVSRT